MSKKKNIKYDSDEELNKVAEARNKKIEKEGIQNLRDQLRTTDLLDYAIDTYITPNNLKGSKIAIEFSKRSRNKEFNSEKDIDDYFKKYSEPEEEWFDDYPKKKESKTGKKIKKLIEKVSNTKLSEPSNKKHFDSISSIMDLVGSLIKKPKEKSYPDINESMAEVNKLLKTPKNKLDKDILLEPYKYKNMNIVDQIAHSLQNPEFEAIKKKKIIESYSYDTIKKFNEKYPELMLKLFKTEEGVDKVLMKKADKSEKNKLSEIKKTERLKKYAEKKKEERQVKKVEKTKHLRDLTPEEHKKFLQARNYYMRKSKTSDILPKNLNKEDPEALNGVCRQLAIDNFSTMSEQLFMKEYEG